MSQLAGRKPCVEDMPSDGTSKMRLPWLILQTLLRKGAEALSFNTYSIKQTFIV